MSRPNEKPRFALVAVDARAIKFPLTYLLPASLVSAAVVGKRALVPLGSRKVTGYMVAFPESADVPEKKLKPILQIIDDQPLFSAAQLELFQFAARYYFAPLGEVIKTALPAGINMKSHRMAGVTIKGGQAFHENPGEFSGRELALLEQLVSGPRETSKLESGNKKSLAAVLKKLERQGHIWLGQDTAGPRVREKTGRAFRLARDPGAEELSRLDKRAPEQGRLVTLLRERGVCSASSLRGEFRDPSRLASILAQKGLVEVLEVTVERDPFSLDLPIDPPPEQLMAEQSEAVDRIGSVLSAGEFRVFLLHGVTGSGKTEVYLRVIRKAVDSGRSAIMLVPEIALTPQLLARFGQRFSASELAVLHSGLSPGERLDQWNKIRRGEGRVVLGARSALFAPVADLGVIVVDEEQDSAYKQDSGFMYNARDLAVMRGKLERAVVALGSATPSLESSWRAREEGGYGLLTLPRRAVTRAMPRVEVVDMRAIVENSGVASSPSLNIKDHDRLSAGALFSPRLREELALALDRGEQSVLFINRRGIFSFMVCFDCGARQVCPNCSVSLTYHQARTMQADDYFGEPGGGGYLLCHYCGYHAPAPEVCPSCHGVRLEPFGAGTEQVESEARGLFPEARVTRVDSDVMAGRESYFRLLDRLCRHEIDILVGTQIVAKGHDLPGVTLVGVMLADIGMNMPDFRATERTFQILTQVAGRAGRGDRPGKVLIQTFQPEHYAVTHALSHDHAGFYEIELEKRRALSYPPFWRLANFRFSGISADEVKRAAKQAGAAARTRTKNKIFAGKVKVLGPAPAPLSRLNGKSRWMMLVKAETPSLMSEFCGSLLSALAKKEFPASVKVELDRDPVSML